MFAVSLAGLNLPGGNFLAYLVYDGVQEDPNTRHQAFLIITSPPGIPEHSGLKTGDASGIQGRLSLVIYLIYQPCQLFLLLYLYLHINEIKK